MLEEEKRERSDQRASSDSESEEIVVQPLCACAFLSVSPVVVYTCPKCMGPALRSLEELMNAR